MTITLPQPAGRRGIAGPRWVLTAKHCTDQGGRMAVRVGNVRHADGIRANVTRRVESPSADLSLLRLDRNVNTSYAQLATSDPPVGSTGTNTEQSYASIAAGRGWIRSVSGV